jgi:hypothetical protein
VELTVEGFGSQDPVTEGETAIPAWYSTGLPSLGIALGFMLEIPESAIQRAIIDTSFTRPGGIDGAALAGGASIQSTAEISNPFADEGDRQG